MKNYIIIMIVLVTLMSGYKVISREKVPYKAMVSSSQYYEYIKTNLDEKPIAELEYYLTEALEIKADLEPKKENKDYQMAYDRMETSIYYIELAIDRR